MVRGSLPARYAGNEDEGKNLSNAGRGRPVPVLLGQPASKAGASTAGIRACGLKTYVL